MEEPKWYESKAKEGMGLNFIKTVFGISGYTVRDYGIEHHNLEIMDKIKGKYSSDTNKKISTMPDLAVIDEETKEATLVEVKYQTKNFVLNNIALAYKHMENYIQFWKEAVLIIISPSTPLINCICVDVNKVDKNKHFLKYVDVGNTCFELWDFTTPKAFCLLHEKFPKVTEENFNKQLHLLGVKQEP
jgi:hypothetical protein